MDNLFHDGCSKLVTECHRSDIQKQYLASSTALQLRMLSIAFVCHSYGTLLLVLIHVRQNYGNTMPEISYLSHFTQDK